ncbi:MAG: recombination mediator RecR [Candidatus Eisenbacteria bacterium]
MLGSSERIERLVQELAKMPTIGRRTAQRIALYLLKAPREEVTALVDAIVQMKERVRYCSQCGAITEDDPCMICSDRRRDRSMICVVEEPGNVLAIEKTGEYRGLYHVLHGRLSPLDGIGPDDLTIEELSVRIKSLGAREIIIATNPNVEGEATCSYVAGAIRQPGVKITTIARGVPMGSDLDLADEVTLARAIQGRGEVR